ncbi:hypothetical protein B0T21DRAFT_377941 [Apiosordaria backusii]|uniref:JmjC domain-containing protein n=1 Tax=Apiosordaria backusii TaxID=314023 RepID=A0AA39ZUS4_9PEZI|nr:hypothetical protein B0T21DRAFT_377941 [Apiosordaria backusii]
MSSPTQLFHFQIFMMRNTLHHIPRSPSLRARRGPLLPPACRLICAVRRVEGRIGVGDFRKEALEKDEPLLIKEQAEALPAMTKWFSSHPVPRTISKTAPALSDYFTHEFDVKTVPYELTVPTWRPRGFDGDNIDRFISWMAKTQTAWPHLYLSSHLHNVKQQLGHEYDENHRFLLFEAPISLMSAALRYNATKVSFQRVTQLYIAQAPISDLPKALQEDLATPDIVLKAGKGDVYGSSIWLGLEPTYTPWHCDPNPNYFCQIYGKKVVRLLPPGLGKSLFRKVQAELGQTGSSTIRGDEMMQGAERTLLTEKVWTEEAPEEIMEVEVAQGDSLFIPKGWWHSVKSADYKGDLNGSVNWWFR